MPQEIYETNTEYMHGERKQGINTQVQEKNPMYQTGRQTDFFFFTAVMKAE